MFEYVISAGEGTLVKHGLFLEFTEQDLSLAGQMVEICDMKLLLCPCDADCHTGFLPSEVE